jgi:D-aminopeptidase
MTELSNDSLSELFQGAAEATEEAVYNSLFMATTVHAASGSVEALPVNEVLQFLRSHRALVEPETHPSK